MYKTIANNELMSYNIKGMEIVMATYIKSLKDNEVIYYTHAYMEKPKNGLFEMHSHNVYEIIYIISGDVSYIIEDRKYKLSPGDMIITRPSDYHFIDIDSPVDYNRQSIVFDGAGIGMDMHILPKGLDVVSVSEDSILHGIFSKIDRYSEVLSNEDFFEVLKALTKEIIYNLSVWDADAEKENKAATNPVLTAALKYIKKHLYEIKDISEVADAVFVTESYLYRLFKTHLRQSPKKYIRDKRMLKAQRLLRDGKRPSAVAVYCGFSDYATFYRNYVSFFGVPPSNKNFDFRLTKTED